MTGKMKNSHRSSKWWWKNTSGLNLVAVASWTALVAMFSVVLVSILWETYNLPPETNCILEETVYRYPEYNLDFKQLMKDRDDIAASYGHKLNSAGVERRSNLSLDEFFDLYDAKWPVLVTDIVPTWPAFKKWTRDFFNKTYGDQRVVMKAVNGPTILAETFSIPLIHFMEHTWDTGDGKTNNYWTYLNDELFITTRPELRKDVPNTIYTAEDFFQLFPEEIRPWDCMLLWGTAHSRSLLHIDPYNWTGTNAVLWGTKKWKLFLPGQDDLLYASVNVKGCGFPLQCNKYGSHVDAFATDMELELYPKLKLAQYLEVEQKAGEMLFIPTGWFHQAYNTEETLAVSGQMMNRNNYRYVLEEILKADNLPRDQLPPGFHNLLPPDQLFLPGQDDLLYASVNVKGCGFPLQCNKYGSHVDAFATDMELELYPKLKLAQYLEVEQKAGEMLFIPTGWFHQAYNTEETLAVSGQMMNRNNYRYVLEEILKADNLPRDQLPPGFHNLLPPDQVNIFMSLLPKKILEKGKDLTNNYLSQMEQGL